MTEPSSPDIHLALDVTADKFTVTLTGNIEDIGELETTIFQPDIAEQLIAATEAKLATLKALRLER